MSAHIRIMEHHIGIMTRHIGSMSHHIDNYEPYVSHGLPKHRQENSTLCHVCYTKLCLQNTGSSATRDVQVRRQESNMHMLKLITRHFPNQENRVLAVLVFLAGSALLVGLGLLFLS
jgi:hypothetical protein